MAAGSGELSLLAQEITPLRLTSRYARCFADAPPPGEGEALPPPSRRDVGAIPRQSVGQGTGAGRPAQPASPVARRRGALDRGADRADRHQRCDEAGADDLSPRHRKRWWVSTGLPSQYSLPSRSIDSRLRSVMSTGWRLRPCGLGSGMGSGAAGSEDSGGSRLKTLSSNSASCESPMGESRVCESAVYESATASVCGAELSCRWRALIKPGRRLIARHVSCLARGSQSGRRPQSRAPVDK